MTHPLTENSKWGLLSTTMTLRVASACNSTCCLLVEFSRKILKKKIVYPLSNFFFLFVFIFYSKSEYFIYGGIIGLERLAPVGNANLKNICRGHIVKSFHRWLKTAAAICFWSVTSNSPCLRVGNRRKKNWGNMRVTRAEFAAIMITRRDRKQQHNNNKNGRIKYLLSVVACRDSRILQLRFPPCVNP